jgi:hypothetical protein
MLQLFTPLVIGFMMTLAFQSVGFAEFLQAQRSLASGVAATYVALKSSTYPSFDHLAAEGYAQVSSSSLRRWTRMECALLAEQAYIRPVCLNSCGACKKSFSKNWIGAGALQLSYLLLGRTNR